MSLRNLLREALLSLTANKGRSGLTILGIVVGIAAVIIMVAMGRGATSYVQGEIAGMGSNLIMVTPGGGSMNDGKPGGGGQGAGAVDTLTMADAEAVASDVSGVQASAPEVQRSYEVVADSANKNLATVGTTASYAAIRNLDVASGAWFSDSDEAAASQVVVLGATASTDLFG